MNDSVVSRAYLESYVNLYDQILSADLRSCASRHSGWHSSFIHDVLNRNPSSQDIPLKGGQIQVVANMGPIPSEWDHWNLILDLKEVFVELFEKGSRDASHVADSIISIFKQNPYKGVLDRAGVVLRLHKGSPNDQGDFCFESDSLEFAKAMSAITHLNNLNFFYWSHRSGQYEKLQAVFRFIKTHKMMTKQDYDFITSLSKGKFSLWEKLDTEIVPGALFKNKKTGEVGLVCSSIQYAIEEEDSTISGISPPVFAAIINGHIVETVSVEDYKPIARRKKKEKKNA